MTEQLQIISGEFPGFQLLDSGGGYRLEQWGPYRLSRPDPQVIWERHLPMSEWQAAHAVFESAGERGRWQIQKRIPAHWTMPSPLSGAGKSVTFKAHLTPFKHTGIFAEQAANWVWMVEQCGRAKKPRRILNLFGYTGAASVILSSFGHAVTHVDASKPAIGWAKENQSLSGLSDDSIRWILDDAAKFVQREVRRGQQYDGILMDPPAFGHSPSGKTWKFGRDLPSLLEDCIALLSDDADFLLINGYATNSSAIALGNILEDAMKGRKGTIEKGELCLRQSDNRLLSTGIFTRWNCR